MNPACLGPCALMACPDIPGPAVAWINNEPQGSRHRRVRGSSVIFSGGSSILPINEATGCLLRPAPPLRGRCHRGWTAPIISPCFWLPGRLSPHSASRCIATRICIY
ncbi:hypothetical protein SKAU_G00139040 [Synaphobranchus kaupii]|uniref:Uncharacterized protein n=1 Tax=Synaphobranchus kaupii TaxID=118154 RepID=A0A9Q1J429_SYNKA|nr:hypothetical protein SKAU_G00139040 [Synaphobranchus kaupii]